ncbi:MAG: glycosyl hydrolase family 65 protein [Acidobacteriota bacterium]
MKCALAMVAVMGCAGVGCAQTVLQPESFHHYVRTFEQQEAEATGKAAEDSWPWMRAEIPWFESSDEGFEEMYYFRWYAWQKHVVKTRVGWVITEWLPKPEMKDGFYGALPDAAPFHLGEARWLKDPAIAEDDARFWFSPDADPHKYSDAMAWSVRRGAEVKGDAGLGTSLLPAMEANYESWEKTQQDANGLFWSIDTRDAMEKSISGDGYRPTLNSYMYGDAKAIAAIAAGAGDVAAAKVYAVKAERLRGLIETNLWNAKNSFYEVMSPAKDSEIRAQKKFVDNGTAMRSSGVRELIGYVPWMFDEPPVEHAVAWKQLFAPQGFAGKYGPTTAERRSPRFRFASSDQCTWNGPSWPFATTQTLIAMANLLEDGQAQSAVGAKDYLRLFSAYVLSQHLKLANGDVIPWIDEDLDADTDEWIAKNMLKAKNKQVGRGNYYNHSGFADPLLTGLIGLRPEMGDEIVLKPLLPRGTWSYFAVDALPYHGHSLTIVWDATGKRYGKGKGLTLMVDGRKVASRPELGALLYRMKEAK